MKAKGHLGRASWLPFPVLVSGFLFTFLCTRKGEKKPVSWRTSSSDPGKFRTPGLMFPHGTQEMKFDVFQAGIRRLRGEAKAKDGFPDV